MDSTQTILGVSVLGSSHSFGPVVMAIAISVLSGLSQNLNRVLAYVTMFVLKFHPDGNSPMVSV